MISPVDTDLINMLARSYASGRKPESLNRVAEMLELAADDHERHQVRWWWNEGCRDYAQDMGHLDELLQALENRRAALYGVFQGITNLGSQTSAVCEPQKQFR